MSRLVFLDTETTSLRPDRRAWEIALIVRTESRDVEHHWHVNAGDLDLGNADPQSLRFGGFYDRHPQSHGEALTMTPSRRPIGASPNLLSEAEAMAKVERLTRDAHLVGATPNFDAELLAARMRAHGLCPSWNYHLIDVNSMMIGWLSAQRDPQSTGPAFPLPWRSDNLAAQVGVVAEPGSRHTALGDARWVRDIYDTITECPAATSAAGAVGSVPSQR